MTNARRTIKLLQANADAFPALTISAAAPAKMTDDDHLVALPFSNDPVVREVWAAELTAMIATDAASVCALAANAEGWTHHVRVEGRSDPGRPPSYRDFVVIASGLPDEDTAAAQGYEYGELLVDVVAAASGHRGRAN